MYRGSVFPPPPPPEPPEKDALGDNMHAAFMKIGFIER